jgi:NAD(P)-dependent dehydrogenase (short-subunit alcohol dehydrogenase family)
MSSLAGKVAVVTGGSRGIGLAIASELRARGAAVAIMGTAKAGVEAAAGSLAKAGKGGDVLAVRADVRVPADVTSAFATIASKLGGIDLLVNNAGVGVFAPVADMTDEQFNTVFGTNVTGLFNCCRAVVPHMRARGGGWIVNISSLSSTGPFANGAAYCASKAAVNTFSDAFMQEVRHDGIRVSVVLPGSVDTAFGGGMGRGKEEWALKPEDVAQAVSDLVSFPARSLPSRVEIRPSRPPRKG